MAFDDLVRQLKTAGANLEDGDLVSQLFLSLPDSYDPLVTALENLREEDLNLDLVKQRLLAEEQSVLTAWAKPSMTERRRSLANIEASVVTNSKGNVTGVVKPAT